MPRYSYRCSACDKTHTVFHLADETQKQCELCGATDSLSKVLTRFTTKSTKSHKPRVGDVTEDFIKDARQELDQQKDALNKNR